MDIDGKCRQAGRQAGRQVSPALGAASRRARAFNEALAPLAKAYGCDVCRRRVLYNGLGCPQLVVVGSQVSVPGIVQAAPAILDSACQASFALAACARDPFCCAVRLHSCKAA
jgi:hypothetical protein